MPVPAGTGLSRRSFLLRSSVAMLSVYGASKLRLGALEEGIAQAAGGSEPVLVSIFLDGGVDSLSVLAPTTDSVYRRLRPEPRSSTRSRHRVRRGPGPALEPGREVVRGPPRRGQDDRAPGRRLREPRPVALHLASLLGGRRSAAPRDQRLDGPPAGHDRHRGQPAPGPVARRLAVAGARQPVGAGGGDRRALLRPLGRGRLG